MLKKQIDEMTVQELGKLFPIRISDYQKSWPELFAEEKRRLEALLGSRMISCIHHFGSTSVPGLCAKPTIDILLEIKKDCDLKRLEELLGESGYLFSHQPQNPPPHMMFMKGYSSSGYVGQCFHLHVRYQGDWDELYFRDYLQSHPQAAEEYGALKRNLCKLHHTDREAYTDAKSDFIRKITAIARAEECSLKRGKA